MTAKENYLRWLEKSNHISNLKALVAAQGFVLIMGDLIISNSRSSNLIAPTIFFIAIGIVCAFAANYRYKLACGALVAINLPLAALLAIVVYFEDMSEDPRPIVWLVATFATAVVAAMLYRVRNVPSRAHVPFGNPDGH